MMDLVCEKCARGATMVAAYQVWTVQSTGSGYKTYLISLCGECANQPSHEIDGRVVDAIVPLWSKEM